jgi:hypothetical protein
MLNKVGFDLEAAKKVLQAAKKITLPKRFAKIHNFKGPHAVVLDNGTRRISRPVGDTLQNFKNYLSGSHPDFPPLNNKNRLMFDAVAMGHELDELKNLKDIRHIYRLHHIHGSPKVLLKEHNKLITLPPDYKSLKTYVTNYRNAGREGDILNIGTFRYGESPRLSRHAIRRLTDIIAPKQKF